jgi:sugar/nucleoside kinase (ribokinase family)
MFVVSAEALLDVFCSGATQGGLALDACVGGSPFNVAVGLARLAQPVSFLGGVSTGFVGVVDTVGAGDSFQAALLDWLAQTQASTPAALRDMDAGSLAAALDFAARAAAITCSRRGADLPRRGDLRAEPSLSSPRDARP